LYQNKKTEIILKKALALLRFTGVAYKTLGTIWVVVLEFIRRKIN